MALDWISGAVQGVSSVVSSIVNANATKANLDKTGQLNEADYEYNASMLVGKTKSATTLIVTATVAVAILLVLFAIVYSIRKR